MTRLISDTIQTSTLRVSSAHNVSGPLKASISPLSLPLLVTDTSEPTTTHRELAPDATSRKIDEEKFMVKFINLDPCISELC